MALWNASDLSTIPCDFILVKLCVLLNDESAISMTRGYCHFDSSELSRSISLENPSDELLSSSLLIGMGVLSSGYGYR